MLDRGVDCECPADGLDRSLGELVRPQAEPLDAGALLNDLRESHAAGLVGEAGVEDVDVLNRVDVALDDRAYDGDDVRLGLDSGKRDRDVLRLLSHFIRDAGGLVADLELAHLVLASICSVD